MTTVRAEDREGGVRLLTLDRPPANAINGDLLSDLSAALDAAAGEDSVRAVVITGAGRFFSGGLDLRAAGVAEERPSGTAPPRGPLPAPPEGAAGVLVHGLVRPRVRDRRRRVFGTRGCSGVARLRLT